MSQGVAAIAVRDAQALATDRKIRLEVGATDPPPIVIGDETRLRQVLANLLGNAVKHNQAGTAVTVRVETVGDGPERPATAVLSVCDKGPGMTAEDAARVFERFYRADRARSRAEGSTGLGLAIVAALVAGHRGSVAVRTSPGDGACFVVELPASSGAPGAGT